LAAQVTELGREHDLAALAFERFGENLFVIAVIVIGGVDKVDAEIDRTMQNRESLPFIGLARLPLKRRAAITDR
jgi:hypothetical protein